MPELTAVSAAPATLVAPSPSASQTGSAPARPFGALLRGLSTGASAGKGKGDADDPLANALQALAHGAGTPAPALSQAVPAASSSAAAPSNAGTGSAPRGSAGASIFAGNAAPSATSALATAPASSTAPMPASPAVGPASGAAPAASAPAAASAGAFAPLPPASVALPAGSAPPNSAPIMAASVTPLAAAPSDSYGAISGPALPSADAAPHYADPAAIVGTLSSTAAAALGSGATLLPRTLAGVTVYWLDAGAHDSGAQPITPTQAQAAPPLPPLLSGRSIFVRHSGAPDASVSLSLATLAAPSQTPRAASTAAAQTWTLPATQQPKSVAPAQPGTGSAPTNGIAAAAASVNDATASGQQSSTGSDNSGSDAGARSAFGAAAASDSTAVFGAGATGTLDTSSLAASLALTIRSGVTEARLQLRPAGMGEVSVQITSSRDGVVLRLSAESTTAGDLLRAHAGELRDALAAHGVNVTDLHVLPNQPAPQSADNGGAAWQNGGRRAGRDAQEGSGGDAPPRDDADADGQSD